MWRVGTVVALHDETERRVELTVERLANGEVSPYLTRERVLAPREIDNELRNIRIP